MEIIRQSMLPFIDLMGEERTKHRGRNTGDRTQGTEHRGRNTGDRTQGTEHRGQNTGDRTQGTEHRGRNTEDETQRTKHRGRNTEDETQRTKHGDGTQRTEHRGRTTQDGTQRTKHFIGEMWSLHYPETWVLQAESKLLCGFSRRDISISCQVQRQNELLSLLLDAIRAKFKLLRSPFIGLSQLPKRLFTVAPSVTKLGKCC
jgi:hypothetical protein